MLPQSYFNIDYPLPKLDMAAIPDYASGATEHWGLITYRESNLVLDPKQSSFANRVRVADVIAHELAHQVSWPPTQFYSVGIFCKTSHRFAR